MIKTILVTGGAGFIGSHTCVELINSGKQVICVDDLSNSKMTAVKRIEQITGQTIPFYKTDVCDKTAMDEIFSRHPIDAVIHFAGFKAVGESVEKPLLYYQNNLNATMTLLSCMEKHGVRKIVFSSSATVYGVPKSVPIQEDADTWCTNPYGWTKYMSEQIIKDWCKATPNTAAILLRYFNPIGAHQSGLIGEDPNGIPNNLLPYICQAATGKREFLNVFGNDYDTADGTGVRDYIHVVDLAEGHLAALEYIDKNGGCECVNLGTGTGYSVLDVVKAYQDACGVEIPYRIAPRRAGDIATSFADAHKAERILGWKAKRNLQQMCQSAFHWQQLNPNGYGE